MAGGGSSAPSGGADSPLPKIAGVDTSDVNAEINVTPMVDVMLVLLIIFMITIPAMAYAARLPAAASSEPEKDDRVTLGIDNQGMFHLDEESAIVPAEILAQELRRRYATRPEDHVLYIKADRGIDYGVFLTAIQAAREAGVRRIGAITEGLVEEEGG
jgi:biopolymer transport protein ExbD